MSGPSFGKGPQASGSADSWFIANAPTDINYLLTLVRKQAAVLDKVRGICDNTDTETHEAQQEWVVASIRAALEAAS